MRYGIPTLSKHCFCDITCPATRRQMTRAGSVDLIFRLEDAPGPPARGMRRCSQAEEQASSSKGHKLALTPGCTREAEEHRASGQKQGQSCVSYVGPSAGSWASAIFPGLESEQTFPVCAPCSIQQKECTNELNQVQY